MANIDRLACSGPKSHEAMTLPYSRLSEQRARA